MAPDPPPPPTQAGWYPHPGAPGWEAYWDGSGWGTESRPANPHPQAPAGAYQFEIALNDPPERVPQTWLPTLTTIVSQAGYSLSGQLPGSATYERRYSPGVFWVGYILFFPIGLLLLLARPTQPLTVTWAASDQGSAVRVMGSDKRLTDLFARIENSRQVS